MSPAGAYQRRGLVITGPGGEVTLDAYTLRVAWKFGGYGGRFPGVRRAARRMHPGMAVRLIVALVVAAWVLLLSRRAPGPVPAPVYRVPRLRLADLASARMTTGPPALVAGPEVPVIDP